MERWRQQLEALDQAQMRRALRCVDGPQSAEVTLEGEQVLLLCSNNYLGLADHPALIEAACDATKRYGVGSGASRLVSGSMTLHHRFEERISAFKGTESALLFNSGFAANSGILPALLEEGDVIFSDGLNHASIIDGCRLGAARTVIYPHNDVAALEALMEAEAKERRGRWLIVSDGVFSMDGDVAPLAELVRLKERFEALLMVDDAHGTGVLGATGRGSAELCGCLDQVDLHMGTLGKGLGGAGAYLAGPQVVIDTLINRCRPFIFSTSLPPAVAAAAIAALDIVESDEGAHLRAQLQENRARFVAPLQAAGLNLAGSVTQIVPILTGEPKPTMQAAAQLLADGIFLSGIRPPTVAPGRCRLRATVMATHDPARLEWAAQRVVAALQGEGA